MLHKFLLGLDKTPYSVTQAVLQLVQCFQTPDPQLVLERIIGLSPKLFFGIWETGLTQVSNGCGELQRRKSIAATYIELEDRLQHFDGFFIVPCELLAYLP